MRRALFLIFAVSIFGSNPVIVCAEESTDLLKAGVSVDVDSQTQAMLNAEDSRHDGKMEALDRVDRAEDKDHQTKLKLIEESDSTAKGLLIANENSQHKRKKKDVERQRKLEEKIHSERINDILNKAKKLLSNTASAARRSAGERSAPPPSADQSVNRWEDQSIPERMMELAAEMDRVTAEFEGNAMTAGNKFFGSMSDSISRSAAFMAQDPGTVLPQIVDGLIAYLKSDYNENNQMLYDEAVKAVEEIQNDPASFFGAHAVDIAFSGVGAAAEIAGARAVGAAGELGAAGKVGQVPRSSYSPPPRPTSPSPVRRSPPPSTRVISETRQREERARKAAEEMRRQQDVQRREGEAKRALEEAKRQQEEAKKAADRAGYQKAVRRQQEARKAFEKVKREEAVLKQQEQARKAADRLRYQATLKRQQEARKAFDEVKREESAMKQQNQARKAADKSRSQEPMRREGSAARQEERGREVADRLRRQDAMKRHQQQAKDLERAGQTLRGMANDAREFSSYHLPNAGLKGPINIEFPENANATTISNILKEHFGGGKAKPPFHNGVQGLKSHEEGLPVASSQEKIESALRNAGNTSEGFAFVDEGVGTPGRIYNVRNNGGKVEYRDLETGETVSISLKEKRVFFYRKS